MVTWSSDGPFHFIKYFQRHDARHLTEWCLACELGSTMAACLCPGKILPAPGLFKCSFIDPLVPPWPDRCKQGEDREVLGVCLDSLDVVMEYNLNQKRNQWMKSFSTWASLSFWWEWLMPIFIFYSQNLVLGRRQSQHQDVDSKSSLLKSHLIHLQGP